MPETGRRVVQALPAIAFAVFIVAQGGIVFAVGIAALGVLALAELFNMTRRARPVNLAAFVAVIALCLTALYADRDAVLLVLVLSFPLVFFLAAARPRRDNVTWGMATTFLGILWIGLPLVHAIFLREMDHGGALVLDTLIGVFIGDTCAYFVGREFGRRPIAPRISPKKTLEGLIGGVLGGAFAFWLFGLAYHHDWFAGNDRVVIGLAVALVAPIGDLFESMIKRDLGVKDAGRFFGAHGGVLDRLDAALFALPAAYWVAQAVL